jgi:ABC-2 type transport system permease protein
MLELSFKRVLQYPWAVLLYISFTWINMALTIAVWIIASRSHQSGIITEHSIIYYYFLLLILVPLIQSYATGYISNEQIKKGELSFYLLKPTSFFWNMFLYEVPWRILSFLYTIPIILLYIYFFKPVITVSPYILFAGIILIPFCYLFSFLIEIITAYFSFIFEDTKGIQNVNEVAVILFSGGGIPLFAFPPILLFISSFLPFRYYLYDLILLFQGSILHQELYTFFVLFFSWLVILFMIERIFWNFGLKRFTGEGR